MMREFIVMNTATFVQYKVMYMGTHYKVFSMNGKEAKVTYEEVERGLENGRYKKV